ncbi:hypothetical protein [Amycolatopsis sp. NPDC003731]
MNIDLIVEALRFGVKVANADDDAKLELYNDLRKAVEEVLEPIPGGRAALDEFTRDPGRWDSILKAHLGHLSDELQLEALGLAGQIMSSNEAAIYGNAFQQVAIAESHGVQVGSNNTQNNLFWKFQEEREFVLELAACAIKIIALVKRLHSITNRNSWVLELCKYATLGKLTGQYNEIARELNTAKLEYEKTRNLKNIRIRNKEYLSIVDDLDRKISELLETLSVREDELKREEFREPSKEIRNKLSILLSACESEIEETVRKFSQT